MALIKCEECGKEISDTTYTCTNCGVKTKQYRKVMFWGAIFIGGYTIIWFFLKWNRLI